MQNNETRNEVLIGESDSTAGLAVGYVDGETCNRDGCAGIIDTHPSENCACHLYAPCSSCTGPRNFCPECDWSEEFDG